MMFKKTIVIFAVLTFIMSCSKQPDPFEIGKRYIGNLNDSTQVKDLKTIFPNDSVATKTSTNMFTGTSSDIEVFSATGDKLLTLSPSIANDSTATITTVKIESPVYKTVKNITKLSTFKDIKDNYNIDKIDNLIGNVVVSVKELNAAFTIDKNELPASIRFDNSITIDALQIPGKAKIKYFMLHW